MASVQVRKRWHRGHTSDYEDNYGSSINRYQPNIGNFDVKHRNIGLAAKYSWPKQKDCTSTAAHQSVSKQSSKRIDKYSSGDRDLNVRERELKTTRKPKKRTVQIATIESSAPPKSSIESPTRGIHFRTVEDKVFERLLHNRTEQHLAENMSYIQKIRSKALAHKEDEISADLKRAIRGKSAGQITHAILAESQKNLQEQKRLECEQIERQHYQRGVSEARIIHRVKHIDLTSDRAIDRMGTTIGSSLYNVRKQMHEMTQKTIDLYHDTRWNNGYLNLLYYRWPNGYLKLEDYRRNYF